MKHAVAERLRYGDVVAPLSIDHARVSNERFMVIGREVQWSPRTGGIAIARATVISLNPPNEEGGWWIPVFSADTRYHGWIVIEEGDEDV